jgi:hypothetical protein
MKARTLMSIRIVLLLTIASTLVACEGKSYGRDSSPEVATQPPPEPEYWMTVETPAEFPHRARSDSIRLDGNLSFDLFEALSPGDNGAPDVTWLNNATGQSGIGETWYLRTLFPEPATWHCFVSLVEGENRITVSIIGNGGAVERSMTVFYVPGNEVLLRVGNFYVPGDEVMLRAGSRYELLESGVGAGEIRARLGITAAFEGRCIPPSCVARRLKPARLRLPRALLDGRSGALGATDALIPRRALRVASDTGTLIQVELLDADTDDPTAGEFTWEEGMIWLTPSFYTRVSMFSMPRWEFTGDEVSGTAVLWVFDSDSRREAPYRISRIFTYNELR